jgi:peptide/nickel transport system ATP-binding protein
MSTPFLDVRDLTVRFPTDDGLVHAVNGVDFQVDRGKVLGIVGESGSGKSVTSQALMGLMKGTSAKVGGQAVLDGTDLIALPESAMRPLRGRRIGMIFQDPLSALHPLHSVGRQVAEAYRVHNRVRKAQARKVAVDMLGRVGIPHPERRYDEYPHQFSGGMRQRAMIAMALICEPELLIADEPTTALDVTVQAQILDLMLELQQETDSALILITHDLGVVAEVCDDVLVMYGGQCVESGTVDEIFYRTGHPYTQALLNSIPALEGCREELVPIPGQPPSLLDLSPGCLFRDRCRGAELVPDDRCRTDRPALTVETGAHHRRCHLAFADVAGLQGQGA